MRPLWNRKAAFVRQTPRGSIPIRSIAITSKTRIVRETRDSYYHCVSRIVDRRFVFGEEEKRFFSHWMRRLEKFCGIEVATWCLMSNHFVAACGDDREFGFANH